MSNGRAPGPLPPAGPAEVGDAGRIATANGHARAPRTVAALCEQFGPICESAVDPLEIASALELEGLGDQVAKLRYGFRDVFALAQDMYFRVPRDPTTELAPPPDPWQGSGSRWRPALHSLLYALPGICFPAAIGLLIGGGVEFALIVALAVAWSMGQGLAYLGYTRLGRTMDVGQTRRVLRLGMAAGLTVVVLAMVVTGRALHTPTSALLFGAGEGVYMLGAGAAMVLGAEVWLTLALAPGVLASAAFLSLGRHARLEHLTWAALAATPILALVIALVCTRSTGQRQGELFQRDEWIGALPAIAFGLVAAGLLIFPVAAGPDGHGGINVGALLAALPLSLSMGGAEWALLWYRRRVQRLLRTCRDMTKFAVRARLILLAAVTMYVASAVALMALTIVVAARTGLVVPRLAYLPQLGVYLVLAAAMFLALTLLAFGSRIFPLVACACALAFELVFRDFGMLAQIVATADLLLALGGFAAIVLSRTARHAYY